MKRIIRILAAAVIVAATSFTAYAENHPKENWREKVKLEKIAFLTMEMDLTPEEAQAFWPLYNQAETAREKANEALFEAYREMSKSVKESKSEKELKSLLDKWLEAKETSGAIDAEYTAKYRRVISEEKVVKLYIGEEKFRRQQIARFRHGGSPGPKKSGK